MALARLSLFNIFISNLGEGVNSVLMKFTEDTELGGVGNTSARGEKEQRGLAGEGSEYESCIGKHTAHISGGGGMFHA